VSRPIARHEKPFRESPASVDLYDDGPHDVAPYGAVRYDQEFYDQARYEDGLYEEVPYNGAPYSRTLYSGASYNGDVYGARYDQPRYDGARCEDVPYENARYDDEPRYDEPQYDEPQYDEPQYDEPQYDEPRFDWAQYDGVQHDEPRFDEARHDGTPHDRGVPDRRRPPGRPGAHARHKRPSRLRRKPVRIAAALAGSTLLVSAAAPVVAHWHGWRPHTTALDQENPLSTGSATGSRIAGQPAASQNALDQWAKIPIGKHAATQIAAAKQAARHPAVHRSPAPQQSQAPTPQATAAAAYQNPLRAVSDLVLERVDMGVDFGGAGPVYALGDGVITNATSDSSGWPGGGWITYQLTDGPDAGLVVYLAEDVTPTVQVGQKVTSSTVIANMFNGGDGIETGWATSDGSTAESQMAAAGGISGGGPFPTMVGLSFDAVLESVGVPAAPNANQAGNGLLPAGYPPV
jgi:hypothetical protein